MADELTDKERLLIKLEQQMQNTKENHTKIMELTKEIFAKIDSQSKETFDVKSKLDTLKETTDLKFKEMEKQLEEILHNVKETTELKFREAGRQINDVAGTEKSNHDKFEEFKEKEFRPVAEDVQKAKGALVLVKFIYPVIAIVMQIIAIAVAVFLGKQ